MAVVENSPASRDTSSLLIRNEKYAARENTGSNAGINRAVIPAFLTDPFKIFKQKGVILVLLFSFSSNNAFFFIINGGPKKYFTVDVNPAMIAVSCAFLYPLLGWLADVHFSRYRVIKWFLRIMWLVSVLFCLASLLLDYFTPTNRYIKKVLTYSQNTALTVGLGGFQANIIQFGVDQLVDASSREISSFISWYICLGFLSEIPLLLIQAYVSENYIVSMSLLLLSFCLTIAVSSDYIFNSCLVKEPPSSNPLTLIYKVLRYAAKNKYPRLRSAFTYWEDKPFSRIDLGKSKYGGPFTTEEVENVKTFWRLFGIIMIGSIFISLAVITYPATEEITQHLQGRYPLSFSWNFGSFVIVAFMPIYEFILDPLLRKYFHIPIMSKVIVGLVLFLLSLAGYIVIEGVGRYLTHNVYNMTCFLDNSKFTSNVTLPLNKMWTVIPSAFDVISKYLSLLAAVRFIYAQSPYSMKGLMLGLGYGCVGFFLILSFVSLPFSQLAIKKWLPPHYGCEMWYLLFIFILLLIISIIFCCVVKVYKLRFRDDDLANEQMFAIHYYSQVPRD